MTQRNDCSRMHECSCECPSYMGCPFDEIPLKKNRSKSRNRHHGKVKAKNKSIENAKILVSKADKLPQNANWEEIVKAEQKAARALKESEKY